MLTSMYKLRHNQPNLSLGTHAEASAVVYTCTYTAMVVIRLLYLFLSPPCNQASQAEPFWMLKDQHWLEKLDQKDGEVLGARGWGFSAGESTCTCVRGQIIAV